MLRRAYSPRTIAARIESRSGQKMYLIRYQEEPVDYVQMKAALNDSNPLLMCPRYYSSIGFPASFLIPKMAAISGLTSCVFTSANFPCHAPRALSFVLGEVPKLPRYSAIHEGTFRFTSRSGYPVCSTILLQNPALLYGSWLAHPLLRRHAHPIFLVGVRARCV